MMNVKRFLLAALAVFVVSQVFEFLYHGVMLRPTYESLNRLWRPDMNSKMWIMSLVAFLVSFPFTWIFVKGYEGKGLWEGVRFGILIGLYTAIPMAYGTYAMIEIPYTLALSWFVGGLLEAILLGVVAAAVYKPRAAKLPAAPAAA